MRISLLILVLSICLSSCNLGLMRHRVDPALEQFAHEYLNTLRSADLFGCQKISGEELSSDGGRLILSAYYNFLSHLKTDSFQLISSKDSSVVHKKGEAVNIQCLLFECKTDQGFLSYEIGISTYDNGRFAESIHLTSSKTSLKVSNQFHFGGKPMGYYAFIALMALIVLFVLFTLQAILRSDIGDKWLWALGNFVGVFGLCLNWTTGEISLKLLFIQLASVGFHTDLPFGALSFAMSLPIFSIWFWVKKRKMDFDREVME